MSILINKILSIRYISMMEIFSQKGKIYTFLNPVSYLTALKNKQIFCHFDGIFSDGLILVKAIKLLYGKTVKRKSFDMTSIAPELFSFAEKNQKAVYIVASTQEQIEKSITILQAHYPLLKIVGYRNGYFDSEEEQDTEAKHICQINPHFLIVGMGTPLQEKFLIKVKEKGFQGIGFTCGGFIHQTSQNKINYYPKWVDKANLRFIYRIWKEPHTRRRYLTASFLFPIQFLIERISDTNKES